MVMVVAALLGMVFVAVVVWCRLIAVLMGVVSIMIDEEVELSVEPLLVVVVSILTVVNEVPSVVGVGAVGLTKLIVEGCLSVVVGESIFATNPRQ
jgi:hypothetical protein